MKERLEQLTASQFIDLLCGDTKVLLSRGEIANPDKVAIAMRNIVMEYRKITDPGGTHSYLQKIEDMIKAKIEIIIFTMCINLVSLNQYEKAREILNAYGVSTSGWNDKRVEGTIHAKLSQAKRIVSDFETENDEPDTKHEHIHAQFDEQTAALMAHFKFQIDPATIKATLYANLIARHNREIKAQMSALKKK